MCSMSFRVWKWQHKSCSKHGKEGENILCSQQSFPTHSPRRLGVRMWVDFQIWFEVRHWLAVGWNKRHMDLFLSSEPQVTFVQMQHMRGGHGFRNSTQQHTFSTLCSQFVMWHNMSLQQVKFSVFRLRNADEASWSYKKKRQLWGPLFLRCMRPWTARRLGLQVRIPVENGLLRPLFLCVALCR